MPTPSAPRATTPLPAAHTSSSSLRLPSVTWQQLAGLGIVGTIAALGIYRVYSTRSVHRSAPHPTASAAGPAPVPLPPAHTVDTGASTLTVAPLPSPPPPSSTPHPLVVAVDLDEVLGEFVPSLLSFHNAHYGTSLQLSSFHSYLFHEVWGGSFDDAVAKVHLFFASPYFLDMPPIPEAAPTLRALLPHCRFHVVTARQHSIEAQTRQWLHRHYPHIFSSILLGNHFSHAGRQRSKADMCQEVGARVLIDDSATHARAVAGVVDHVLLYDRDAAYMWSKGTPEHDAPMPPNVRRVHSWAEIHHFLASLLPPPPHRTAAVRVIRHRRAST